MMKREWIRLLERYGTALQQHVKLGSLIGLQLARTVGQQAAVTGLRTLDLARLHEQALVRLGLPVSQDEALPKTDAFFAAAWMSLERTTPRGRKAAAPQLTELKATLRRRTTELVRSQRLSEQRLVERDALKEALRKKAEHHADLLAESRDLQRCLQNLTRRVFSSQEEERASLSRGLHNDVTQAMLGIQVRLAQLKKEAARNTTGLKREIASTQHLVEKSAKTLERFTSRLGQDNET